MVSVVQKNPVLIEITVAFATDSKPLARRSVWSQPVFICNPVRPISAVIQVFKGKLFFWGNWCIGKGRYKWRDETQQ
jgi:hypothetical protein